MNQSIHIKNGETFFEYCRWWFCKCKTLVTHLFVVICITYVWHLFKLFIKYLLGSWRSNYFFYFGWIELVNWWLTPTTTNSVCLGTCVWPYAETKSQRPAQHIWQGCIGWCSLLVYLYIALHSSSYYATMRIQTQRHTYTCLTTNYQSYCETHTYTLAWHTHLLSIFLLLKFARREFGGRLFFLLALSLSPRFAYASVLLLLWSRHSSILYIYI